MTTRLAAAVTRRWYETRPSAWLRPLAVLYGAAIALRRLAYRRGWRQSFEPARPVLVVGNLSVGGSGKTPLVMALVARAAALGIPVGVVARGYGGAAPAYPLVVTADTPAHEAGDEPALIARRTGVPVVVAPDRVAAAGRLAEIAPATRLILADDGLQHYRLRRAGEIAVRDATRGYGNRRLLPAGPLREPLSRLEAVDIEAVQGEGGDFWLTIASAMALDDGRCRSLSAFGDRPVHALAGIGHPERFFAALRRAGLSVIAHPRPDHHVYNAADDVFAVQGPLLMTEKDAVKCANLVGDDAWMVPAEAVLSSAVADRIDGLLERLAAPSPAIDTEDSLR